MKHKRLHCFRFIEHKRHLLYKTPESVPVENTSSYIPDLVKDGTKSAEGQTSFDKTKDSIDTTLGGFLAGRDIPEHQRDAYREYMQSYVNREMRRYDIDGKLGLNPEEMAKFRTQMNHEAERVINTYTKGVEQKIKVQEKSAELLRQEKQVEEKIKNLDSNEWKPEGLSAEHPELLENEILKLQKVFKEVGPEVGNVLNNLESFDRSCEAFQATVNGSLGIDFSGEAAQLNTQRIFVLNKIKNLQTKLQQVNGVFTTRYGVLIKKPEEFREFLRQQYEQKKAEFDAKNKETTAKKSETIKKTQEYRRRIGELRDAKTNLEVSAAQATEAKGKQEEQKNKVSSYVDATVEKMNSMLKQIPEGSEEYVMIKRHLERTLQEKDGLAQDTQKITETITESINQTTSKKELTIKNINSAEQAVAHLDSASQFYEQQLERLATGSGLLEAEFSQKIDAVNRIDRGVSESLLNMNIQLKNFNEVGKQLAEQEKKLSKPVPTPNLWDVTVGRTANAFVTGLGTICDVTGLTSIYKNVNNWANEKLNNPETGWASWLGVGGLKLVIGAGHFVKNIGQFFVNLAAHPVDTGGELVSIAGFNFAKVTDPEAHWFSWTDGHSVFHLPVINESTLNFGKGLVAWDKFQEAAQKGDWGLWFEAIGEGTAGVAATIAGARGAAKNFSKTRIGNAFKQGLEGVKVEGLFEGSQGGSLMSGLKLATIEFGKVAKESALSGMDAIKSPIKSLKTLGRNTIKSIGESRLGKDVTQIGKGGKDILTGKFRNGFDQMTSGLGIKGRSRLRSSLPELETSIQKRTEISENFNKTMEAQGFRVTYEQFTEYLKDPGKNENPFSSGENLPGGTEGITPATAIEGFRVANEFMKERGGYKIEEQYHSNMKRFAEDAKRAYIDELKDQLSTTKNELSTLERYTLEQRIVEAKYLKPEEVINMLEKKTGPAEISTSIDKAIRKNQQALQQLQSKHSEHFDTQTGEPLSTAPEAIRKKLERLKEEKARLEKERGEIVNSHHAVMHDGLQNTLETARNNPFEQGTTDGLSKSEKSLVKKAGKTEAYSDNLGFNTKDVQTRLERYGEEFANITDVNVLTAKIYGEWLAADSGQIGSFFRRKGKQWKNKKTYETEQLPKAKAYAEKVLEERATRAAEVQNAIKLDTPIIENLGFETQPVQDIVNGYSELFKDKATVEGLAEGILTDWLKHDSKFIKAPDSIPAYLERQGPKARAYAEKVLEVRKSKSTASTNKSSETQLTEPTDSQKNTANDTLDSPKTEELLQESITEIKKTPDVNDSTSSPLAESELTSPPENVVSDASMKTETTLHEMKEALETSNQIDVTTLARSVYESRIAEGNNGIPQLEEIPDSLRQEYQNLYNQRNLGHIDNLELIRRAKELDYHVAELVKRIKIEKAEANLQKVRDVETQARENTNEPSESTKIEEPRSEPAPSPEPTPELSRPAPEPTTAQPQAEIIPEKPQIEANLTIAEIDTAISKLNNELTEKVTDEAILRDTPEIAEVQNQFTEKMQEWNKESNRIEEPLKELEREIETIEQSNKPANFHELYESWKQEVLADNQAFMEKRTRTSQEINQYTEVEQRYQAALDAIGKEHPEITNLKSRIDQIRTQERTLSEEATELRERRDTLIEQKKNEITKKIETKIQELENQKITLEPAANPQETSLPANKVENPIEKKSILQDLNLSYGQTFKNGSDALRWINDQVNRSIAQKKRIIEERGKYDSRIPEVTQKFETKVQLLEQYKAQLQKELQATGPKEIDIYSQPLADQKRIIRVDDPMPKTESPALESRPPKVEEVVPMEPVIKSTIEPPVEPTPTAEPVRVSPERTPLIEQKPIARIEEGIPTTDAAPFELTQLNASSPIWNKIGQIVPDRATAADFVTTIGRTVQGLYGKAKLEAVPNVNTMNVATAIIAEKLGASKAQIREILKDRIPPVENILEAFKQLDNLGRQQVVEGVQRYINSILGPQLAELNNLSFEQMREFVSDPTNIEMIRSMVLEKPLKEGSTESLQVNFNNLLEGSAGKNNFEYSIGLGDILDPAKYDSIFIINNTIEIVSSHNGVERTYIVTARDGRKFSGYYTENGVKKSVSYIPIWSGDQIRTTPGSGNQAKAA